MMIRTRFLIPILTALVCSPTWSKEPIPADREGQAAYFTQSTAAFKDYMLQCAGCHRFDGLGAEHRGIPSFKDSIGLFTHLAAGRNYMIRVPGSAQSQLTNADLARVLNWIVFTYSPEQLPDNFRPFTAAEVGAARPYRFDDVVPVRKKLESELSALGHEPSNYMYGRTGRQAAQP